MRIDHLAYQRATNIAGFGFVLQLVVATVLLLFGLRTGDTTSEYASFYLYTGLIIWLGLIIIFNQHKLERLESLEEGELVASSGSGESIFDRSGDEIRPAIRRLRLMYKWAMPGASILVIVILLLLAWVMFEGLAEVSREGSGEQLEVTVNKGWLIAISLGFAVVSFIFSRYLAGMAAQKVWQNLRAGAGVMVGNAIVLLAVTIGTIFRFFEIESVIWVVAWLIPILMIVVASEVLLNLLLNLYRPRTSGEFPRAAFDSRGLSLLATPDSFVRSLNDAINYQFGFDITSSWGYQLFLRSGAWLVVLGFLVLLGLSTLSVVDGREQGLRLRSGAIVGEEGKEVHGSGFFWKLPWPIESTALYDVSSIRPLPLTPLDRMRRIGFLWEDEVRLRAGEKLEPFIVGRSTLGLDLEPLGDGSLPGNSTSSGSEDFGDEYALVDMLMLMEYRIQDDLDGETPGLLRYLSFGNNHIQRNEEFTDRERSLRDLALSVTTRYIATRSLDEVLSDERAELSESLRTRIQQLFDERGTGIDVVSIDIPMVRPSGDAAADFQDLPLAVQQRDQTVARAERNRITLFTAVAGTPDIVDEVLAAIDVCNASRRDLDAIERMHGTDSTEAEDARKQLTVATVHAEELLRQGGGHAASLIESAERDRWIEIMDKRAQADRVKSQVAAFQAAPELYRQRAIMQTYVARLGNLRKYIVGISPERMNVNVELRDLASPNTIFEGVENEDTTP